MGSSIIQIQPWNKLNILVIIIYHGRGLYKPFTLYCLNIDIFLHFKLEIVIWMNVYTRSSTWQEKKCKDVGYYAHTEQVHSTIACHLNWKLVIDHMQYKFEQNTWTFFEVTVVIRYSTIDGDQYYDSCYKPIELYKMAWFELVMSGYDGRYVGYGIGLHGIQS